MFDFSVSLRYKNARTGIFNTPHGGLETPEIAFVATEGEIKTIPPDMLSQLPINYLIVNTFHIWVKDIMNRFHPVGGNRAFATIHNYMKYSHIVASDSGGFQVFSMGFGKAHNVGKIGGLFPGSQHNNMDEENPVRITEDGVGFEFNGTNMQLTPETSIALQEKIGADIIFAFDECTSPLNSYKYTKEAMDRTHRWIHRCIKAKKRTDQALFAIVQGGYFEDLRKASAQYMGKLDVPGYGIGGSLGKTKEDMIHVLEWSIPHLPDNKPRHLLGIGKVSDIFDSVERGIDLFDCVIPTREARHKVIYTKKGRLAVRKFRECDEPFEKDCACIACREKVTWKKLNQLFTLHDPRAPQYATIHNIQFYSDLMKNISISINNKSLDELKTTYSAYFSP